MRERGARARAGVGAGLFFPFSTDTRPAARRHCHSFLTSTLPVGAATARYQAAHAPSRAAKHCETRPWKVMRSKASGWGARAGRVMTYSRGGAAAVVVPALLVAVGRARTASWGGP